MAFADAAGEDLEGEYGGVIAFAAALRMSFMSLGRPVRAAMPASWLSIFSRAAVGSREALLARKIEDEAGVEVAGAGSHDDTAGGGEAHVVSTEWPSRRAVTLHPLPR